MRQTANLSNGFKLISPVQFSRKKYSAFRSRRTMSSLGHPASCRGTYASSRYVECGLRWTRRRRTTSAAAADGEIVWSWRPDAGAKFDKTLTRLAGDGGKKARSPGRSRISRKTVAQGRPDDRPHLWFLPLCFFTAQGAMGARWYPAFPAPSRFRRDMPAASLGAPSLRERGAMSRVALFEKSYRNDELRVG